MLLCFQETNFTPLKKSTKPNEQLSVFQKFSKIYLMSNHQIVVWSLKFLEHFSVVVGRKISLKGNVVNENFLNNVGDKTKPFCFNFNMADTKRQHCATERLVANT